MDKQIKYLLGVLIILLISAYFLSLLGDLPHYFKDDIIAFLEERVSGEISFSSVSLWPLNRLKLNSFSFEDKNNNKFKVEQLNLNYSLDFNDSDSIFEINLIEAKDAEITINEELFNNLKTAAASTEQEQQNKTKKESGFKLKNLDLPQFMNSTKINIINSSLFLKNKDTDLKLQEFNLGLNAESAQNYTANISTAVSINTLNFNNLKFADLNGDKLEIQFSRNESNANLYFNSEGFTISPLISILNKKNYNYNGLSLDLETLNGQFSAQGELKFEKNKLIDYKSEIKLNNSNFTAFYSRNNIKEKLGD